MNQRLAALREEWRPAAITGGWPIFPLGVLFGLNAVDELDRAAYAILLPEIRDHFGLDNEGILTLVALSSFLILLLEIPLAQAADRKSRVRIATAGAAAWAIFSVGTGMAVAVWMLVATRVGAGLGRSVVTPTHNSLLADYYPPEQRVKVFGFHRLANSLGQIAGPLLAGIIAVLLGWRWPFFFLTIPTIVMVVLARRLVEPVRGRFERKAGGAADDVLDKEAEPLSFFKAVRLLGSVRTMRRFWCSLPFLGVALAGVPSLLAIIYEDLYGVNELGRGAIAAAVEPAQVVGVLIAMPYATRLVHRDPGLLLRFTAVIGVINGLTLVGLAFAPNLALAILCNIIVAATVGTIAPAVFAILSLIVPPQVRSIGFTIISLIAAPGVLIILPTIGRLADDYGIRPALLVLVPVTFVAGLMLAWAGGTAGEDVSAVQVAAAEAALKDAD